MDEYKTLRYWGMKECAVRGLLVYKVSLDFETRWLRRKRRFHAPSRRRSLFVPKLGTRDFMRFHPRFPKHNSLALYWRLLK